MNTENSIWGAPASKLSNEHGKESGVTKLVFDSLPVPVSCGEFINSVQATYSTPDSIYFDRFGNTYNRDFDPQGAPRSGRSSTTGYFNLEFGDPITYQNETISFTSEIQEIFNVVFDELKDIIELRQFEDPCDNPLPVHTVNISVEWGPSLEPEVIAAASPVFYHEPGICTGEESILVLGMPENKIKGFYQLPNGYDGKDAIILLNPKFVHEELLDTDYPASVDVNLYDLYTVVMHEAFHVLGFISQIGPDPVEFVTNFDRLLYSETDSRYFIESDCSSACYTEAFDESEKNSLLQASCEVLVGESGPSTISEVSFGPRVFSHLDNGSCESGYLMQPLTPPGTRRFPQEEEWNILCQLGYKLDVSSPSVNCDGCYLFAESIIRQPVENFGCLSGGCCQHDFHTCEESIEISFDELLCRVKSSDVSVSIIDAYAFNSGADVTLQSENILVERNNYGGVQISFVASGCENCQTTIGSVFVVFDQCLEDAEPVDVCDNMLLTEDFEEFVEANGVNFGYPYIFDGFCNNTPDIKLDGGLKHVSLNGSLSESVTFKAVDVSEEADCDIQLDLEFYLSSAEDELLVWISEYPPCQGEFVPFGCDLSQSFICEDMSEYNPVCLDLGISGINYANDEWHAEAFVIPRNVIPANAHTYYFIFSATSTAGGSVLIQSMKATCMVEPVITYDVSCMEVCLAIEGISGDFLWDFGDNHTSTDMNPCHTYANAGTYEVTVTVDNECPWTIPDDITVEVAPCGGTDYCEEYDEMDNDWVIGSQPCSMTNASDVWPSTSGIVGKKLLINGRLIMDKNMEFDHCIIEMGPHAEIFIKPFIIMGVASSTFYSCEYLWRTIRVGFNGALWMYKNDPQDADNIVANAWSGIFAYSLSNLHLSDIVFDANMVGLYIPPVPTIPDVPLPTTLPNMINLTKFDNLKFMGSELLPPYNTSCIDDPFSYSNFFTVSPLAASYCGVLIHDVGPEVNLSATSLESKILYSGMRSGIIAKRSNTKVENSVFRDLQNLAGSNYPSSGFGILSTGQNHRLLQKGFGKGSVPSFRNVRRPVSAQGVDLTVKENRMIDNITIGVVADNCKNQTIIVEDNSMDAKFTGLFLTHNDPVMEISVKRNDIGIDDTDPGPTYGIRSWGLGMHPHVGAIFEDNVVSNISGEGTLVAIQANSVAGYNMESNMTLSKSGGIKIYSGDEVIVRSNTVKGISDDAGSGIYVEMSPNSIVVCNDLLKNEFGLHFNHVSMLSKIGQNVFHDGYPSTNSLYYTATAMTSPQINMQNTWCDETAIMGGYEAFHEDPNLAFLSEYQVLSNSDECFSPDPVSPVDGWYKYYPSLPAPLSCPEYDRSTRSELSEFERLIAIDSLESPENAPAYLWNVQRDLYEILTEWPDTSWSGSVYGGFLDQMDTSAVGIWYAIEEDIYQLLLPDPDIVELQSDITDTLTQWLEDIAFYRGVIDTASSSVDSLNAVLAIDTLQLELETFTIGWDLQWVLLDSLRKVVLFDMLTQVNAAPASDDWTESLQTVWSAVLKMEIFGPDTLNGSLVSDLHAIASECPLTHGRAVYLAASLLSTKSTHVYDFACAPPSPLLSATSEPFVSSGTLRVIPNPATDRLLIGLTGDQPDGNIFITYISGAQALTQRVSGSTMEISVAHLPAGMYILTWKPASGNAHSLLLSIQR